jgi:hypothetical protein
MTETRLYHSPYIYHDLPCTDHHLHHMLPQGKEDVTSASTLLSSKKSDRESNSKIDHYGYFHKADRKLHQLKIAKCSYKYVHVYMCEKLVINKFARNMFTYLNLE